MLFIYNIALGNSAPNQPIIHSTQEDISSAEEYIQTYSNFAIQEMEKTSVIASIILAQGMLESGYGTSGLATKANNHFGIKCGSDWRGQTYYYDSKENDNGTMVSRNSCFRSYNTAEESYRDHANYLSNRANYALIFKANTKDYRFWATKIQEAGYATDPQYAQKLIRIIETYGLDKYDRYTNTNLAINNLTEESDCKWGVSAVEAALREAESDKVELLEKIDALILDNKALKEMVSKLQVQFKDQELNIKRLERILENTENNQQLIFKSDPLMSYFNPDGTPKENVDLFPSRVLDNEGIFYQSGRKATVVGENRNLFEIAVEYNITLKDLLKYNDLEDDKRLPNGFYVYIESKANYIKSKTEPHQVQIGETVHTISQRYGIKTAKIYQRNHLKKGEEPELGEFVFLNTTSEQQPKLKDMYIDASDSQFSGGGSSHK